jgi:hypothetical protein
MTVLMGMKYIKTEKLIEPKANGIRFSKMKTMIKYIWAMLYFP